MSSEEQFAETETTDEQRVLEQERADEEREASFLALAVAPASPEPSTSALPAQSPARPSTDADTSKQPPSSRKASPAKAKGRKSRVSEAIVQEQAPEQSAPEQSAPSPSAAKKPRVSFNPTTSQAEPPEQAPNVRMDRLREALGRFLDLIDYKASASNIAKSLPHIDQEIVTALRTQFVEQLKEAIKDENEKLIAENDLDHKLQELHELTQEADKRYHDGLKSGSEELKDTWRPDLDIQTAISARAIPEQELRIAQLKKELEQVHSENDVLHRQLRQIVGQTESIKAEAKEALDSLDSAIKGLEATPDVQNQLRQTMDDLLQDLGARV